MVNGTPIVESVGAADADRAGAVRTARGTSLPAPMGEGTGTVTASVTDPAGNTSTATEQLTSTLSRPR